MKSNANVIRAVLLLNIGLLAGAAHGQVSLSIGNVPGGPGSAVSVPINLRQPVGEVVAAQFDVTFDASKVNEGDPAATERLSGHTVKSREIAPGVRRTLIYSLNNGIVEGAKGAIIKIPFNVSPQETVGSGSLTPSNVILARADGTALTPVSLDSGTIFFRPVHLLPDGQAQFFLSATQGERYAVQASTNLFDWETLSTHLATSDFMEFLDADAAAHPYRFYRLELLSP